MIQCYRIIFNHRALKIEDECEELESRISLLEVKIHENESASETNVKDVKLLQAKIDKCKDELADEEDDLMELTQVAQDEVSHSC